MGPQPGILIGVLILNEAMNAWVGAGTLAAMRARACRRGREERNER